MRDFMMAVGGGFCGTAIVIGLSFIFIREYLRMKMTEMMKEAHKKGICPVCKQPMQHDRFIGDVE